MMRSVLSLFLALACLSACATPSALAPKAVSTRAQAPKQAVQQVPWLSGRVNMMGYSLLATNAEVRSNAAVFLLDETGKFCAAGVTDAQGAFTFYPSSQPFSPVVGKTYTIDVVKRMPSNSRLLSLRTLIKREANGWTSITGDTITVNTLTTALANMQINSKGTLDADLVMGAVGPDGLKPTDAFDIAQVAAMGDNLEDRLRADIDPGLTYVKLTGDQMVTSEEQLKALSHVHEIDGNLMIMGVPSEAIALPNLRRVTGILYFISVPGLKNFKGFNSLEEVGGAFCGQDLAGLESLDGLQKLKRVPMFVIAMCPQLKALTGLPVTDQPIDAFGVGMMPEVTSLAGMEGMTNIRSLTLVDMPKLADVSALRSASGGFQGLNLTQSPFVNLTPFASHLGSGLKSIELSNNANLENLSGAEAVTSLSQATVSGNPKLSSLQAFNHLASVTDTFTLSNNAMLGDLQGLEALQSARELLIRNNPALTSVTGLSGLTGVSNSLALDNNAQLASLAGLSGLRSVAGSFTIMGNGGLTSLQGLEGLTSVGVTFSVSGNPILTSLNGLEGLTNVGGIFEVRQNPELISVTGLSALTTVGSGISISQNPKLELDCAAWLGRNLGIWHEYYANQNNGGAVCQ